MKYNSKLKTLRVKRYEQQVGCSSLQRCIVFFSDTMEQGRMVAGQLGCSLSSILRLAYHSVAKVVLWR